MQVFYSDYRVIYWQAFLYYHVAKKNKDAIEIAKWSPEVQKFHLNTWYRFTVATTEEKSMFSEDDSPEASARAWALARFLGASGVYYTILRRGLKTASTEAKK